MCTPGLGTDGPFVGKSGTGILQLVFVFLDEPFALIGFGTVGPGDGDSVGAVVGDGTGVGSGVGSSVGAGTVVEGSVGS